MLSLDSLASVSGGLAIRRLPQADVFAEIGNAMLECAGDVRGRNMNDMNRLARVHLTVVKDALTLNFGDQEFFTKITSEEYA